jgi:hypothetical protein
VVISYNNDFKKHQIYEARFVYCLYQLEDAKKVFNERKLFQGLGRSQMNFAYIMSTSSILRFSFWLYIKSSLLSVDLIAGKSIGNVLKKR